MVAQDGVLCGGPWQFDNTMVVVAAAAAYDSLSNPTLIELQTIKVLIQLKNLPKK